MSEEVAQERRDTLDVKRECQVVSDEGESLEVGEAALRQEREKRVNEICKLNQSSGWVGVRGRT